MASGEFTNMLKLNHTLLNNQQIKEEIQMLLREIYRCKWLY